MNNFPDPTASRLLGVIVGAILCASTASAVADETNTPSLRRSAKEELEFIQKQIRTQLENHRQAQDTRSQRLKELLDEKRARARTIELLTKEVGKKTTTLEEAETNLAEQKSQAASLRERSAELKTLFIDHLREVREIVARGIPWQIESRTREIEKTIAQLGDEKTPAVAGLGSVGRLQKELESLGRLVERSEAKIEHGGEEIAVEVIHLGLLAVIFSNQDGSLLGFSGPGQTLQDGLAAVEDHPEARDGYVRALEILNRRRTPALIDLYLPTVPFASAAKGEDR